MQKRCRTVGIRWCVGPLLSMLMVVTVAVGPSLPARSAAATTLPLVGVYEGPCNTDGVDAYASWLGRQPQIVLDTLDMSRWQYLERPTWWTQCWGGKPWGMTLGVPLIPAQDGGSLQAGAAGQYNAHFETLARTLVAGGQGNANLRLGWEFNGSWYPWRAAMHPNEFAGYWRQIVTTMRAVPGARFTFSWNPTIGPEEFPAERAWPGDSYVDYVGLDVYDMSWAPNTYPLPSGASAADIASRRARAWNGYLNDDHGLNFWASFAARHAKRLAVPEWGLMKRTDQHGGGDNPQFVQNMYTWLTTHPVAQAMYFDAVGDGDSRLRSMPQAAALYKRLFG